MKTLIRILRHGLFPIVVVLFVSGTAGFVAGGLVDGSPSPRWS